MNELILSCLVLSVGLFVIFGIVRLFIWVCIEAGSSSQAPLSPSRQSYPNLPAYLLSSAASPPSNTITSPTLEYPDLFLHQPLSDYPPAPSYPRPPSYPTASLYNRSSDDHHCSLPLEVSKLPTYQEALQSEVKIVDCNSASVI